ncbi:MAG: hexosaminidase, partial [Frankiaceae bacterium]|nr:hexosaminidase [Frankiaceae bacterium]
MTDTLVPRPLTHAPAQGTFTFDASTTVGAEPALANAAAWFTTTIAAATALPLHNTHPARASIAFMRDPQLPAEGYRLTVTTERVEVAASDDAGAFYAAQTLRQLLGP